MKIRLALVTLLFASPAFADAAIDAMFDRARLHNVQITMLDADWTILRARYQENTNYDATLTIDGERISNCTIRSRGSGTRNGIKPGLRVDFNRKVKSQTFHDFNFVRGNHLVYYGAERNRLLSRLLASPPHGAFYRRTLQSILTQHMNPGWMAPRIDAFVALIRSSVLEDTKRRAVDFDDSVSYMRQVIADRAHSIDVQLNPTRRRPVRH